jgi:hypothetical protein
LLALRGVEPPEFLAPISPFYKEAGGANCSPPSIGTVSPNQIEFPEALFVDYPR